MRLFLFVLNDITIFLFLGLNTEGDILLPFANDRGGTIKYKTNPTLAYQQLQVNNDIMIYTFYSRSSNISELF